MGPAFMIVRVGAQWVSFVENEESLLDRANQSK